MALMTFRSPSRWRGCGPMRSRTPSSGWVATKMGGPTAPDDLNQGPVTQAWLAAGDDLAANVTAHHFYHQQIRQPHPQARNPEVQNALVAACAALTGVSVL